MKFHVHVWSECKDEIAKRFPQLVSPPSTGTDFRPIEVSDATVGLLFADGFDLQMTHHRPMQTRKEIARDGLAADVLVLQISPNRRGFRQV